MCLHFWPVGPTAGVPTSPLGSAGFPGGPQDSPRRVATLAPVGGERAKLRSSLRAPWSLRRGVLASPVTSVPCRRRSTKKEGGLFLDFPFAIQTERVDGQDTVFFPPERAEKQRSKVAVPRARWTRSRPRRSSEDPELWARARPLWVEVGIPPSASEVWFPRS